MSSVLNAPENFRVIGKDGSSLSVWDKVAGADGYKLFFYSAENPDKCIKTRYASQNCKKMILGFKNGKEYLCCVCAVKNENGGEVLGNRTEKLPFVPVSNTLKAQNTICLSVGEKARINWEYKNTIPKVSFVSDNPSVATVSSEGIVTANKKGTTYITITSENRQTFRTKIAVERDLSSGKCKAVLMLTGDIMCAVNHQRIAKNYSFDFGDSFTEIKKTLSQADYSVGVLETSCYDRAPFEYEQLRLSGGSPNCNSPSSFISAIADAGFGGLVTANNHNCDTGVEGLSSTVSEIRRLGIKNLGTLGDNPVVVDVRGIKVAFLSCCMISNGLEGEQGIVNTVGKYDRDYFVELVNNAFAMGAEYIIAYQHWGGMNTKIVNKNQLSEAQFMAESGADLIVGSHPHFVQKFCYLKTSSGKQVPCAFSLGNFLTTMNEFPENRDSAILRVELLKEQDKVSAKLSYVPCYCENREFGASVVPAFPPHSIETHESFGRTKSVIGNKINHFPYRPKVLLSGSSNLEKIFGAGREFRVDKTAMYLSQLSLGSEKGIAVPEDCDGKLALDFGKDLSVYIGNISPDYIAVDFLTAATVSCYRYKDMFSDSASYFTNTKRFRTSDYFNEHKGDLQRIKPPFGEEIWKPLVERYAKQLTNSIPSDRIILFRSSYTDTKANCGELRSVPASARQNKFCRAMEDYFISIVNPAVIDLSDKYFPRFDSLIAFEDAYYYDAYRAVKEITVGVGRKYISVQNSEIWFERVMKYYDNMTARSYQSRILDLNRAADLIIARTSKEFSALNSARLIKLHKAGNTDLESVVDFFVNDPGAEDVIRAAEIIGNVQSGKLDKPYDFYEPAFSGKWNIIKTMVRLLSAEIGAAVNESNAELVFLLRGKAQLKRYTTGLDKVTVDIWGSCISRESINRCSTAFVGKYIFKQAPVLAYEPPIEIAFPDGTDAFCKNSWRKRTMSEAFNKTGFDTLDESEAYFILVDLYDVICKMADYHGNLFETDDFICRTDFYKSIKSECEECYVFRKREMKYCFDAITRFAKDILDRYGENIILLKAEPKNLFINLDYRLQRMEIDPLFEIKKKFISLCEERFASITGCYVIDISKYFYSSDKFLLGGAHIVHYEEEFYRAAAECIEKILSGSKQKVFNTVDENYILLRNLKLKRA